MYYLEVITIGQGPDHYEYVEWSALMEAVDGLQEVIDSGIVSDFTIWTEQ